MTNRRARRAAAKDGGARPPSPADALFQSAQAALARGALGEAADHLAGVLEIDPDHAQALAELGALAHRAGRLEAAKGFFQRAARAAPASAEIRFNLGLTETALGDAVAAEADLRKAIALDPKLAEARVALANLLHAAGKRGEAAEALGVAVRLRPGYAAAHLNLSNVLREEGRLTDAEAAARKAIALQPSPLAWRALAVILQEQGLAAAAIDAFDRALALAPTFEAAASGRLFCLNYDPARTAAEIAEEHRRWGERHPSPSRPARFQDRPRLRIGYVSADFHRHPVGWFFTGVVEAHDKAAVEVVCYSGGDREDDITGRIRRAADRWRDIKGLSDEGVEAMVRADGIDILVDLSGHAAANHLALFQRRPAPVQASWLGYVSTTGLPGMDYLITDAVTAPPGAEALYTETLIRLPHGRFCYTPPDYAPEPAPAPSSHGRPFTFGSFNDLLKVGPEVVRAWSAILHAAPGARLLLKWKALDDQGVRARVLAAFADEGIANERLALRGHAPHEAMLADYAEIDLALDPFPFGGGLTTCEALWMGAPVLTLPMERAASRQSLAFLRAIGLEGLVADSVEDYVARAAGLAGDPARLVALRADLRARMRASPLCRPDIFTPTLEAAYREIWRAAGAGAP